MWGEVENPLHINVRDLSVPTPMVAALNALSLSVTAFPTTSIHYNKLLLLTPKLIAFLLASISSPVFCFLGCSFDHPLPVGLVPACRLFDFHGVLTNWF